MPAAGARGSQGGLIRYPARRGAVEDAPAGMAARLSLYA